MGAARKPGHTCSMTKDRGIDAGTNCRGRSTRPGPTLGLDGGTPGKGTADAGDSSPALFDGGVPDGGLDGGIQIEVNPLLDEELKKQKLPLSDKTTRDRIAMCIKLLWSTPLPARPGGAEIILLLQRLNKAGLIIYSEMDTAFAEWDGEFIHINQAYSFNNRECETAVELVHEGAHAQWRANNPAKAKMLKAHKAQHDINDEFNARKNQLVVYRHFRDKGQFFSEGVYTAAMDGRLKLLAKDGDLRAEIAANWNH